MKTCSTFSIGSFMVGALVFFILFILDVAKYVLNLLANGDEGQIDANEKKFSDLEDTLIYNPLTKIGVLSNNEKYMKIK